MTLFWTAVCISVYKVCIITVNAGFLVLYYFFLAFYSLITIVVPVRRATNVFWQYELCCEVFLHILRDILHSL